ncbi:MAG: M48 family metallopeptidase [Bacteroidales bacterium]|nr:M48 family metallopeptidase [Bacteroidales bacterium]MBN2632786.1 M48 family metallopeptidase [Bacteroidales bacterium]
MEKDLSGGICQDHDGIRYRVIFSGRRSLSIIVSPGKGVIVRAPYGTGLKPVEKFVNAKSEWIRKHLDRQDSFYRINKGRKYADGGVHLYLGEEKILKVIKSDKIYVKLSDKHIETGVRDPENEALIKRVLALWYIREAHGFISLKMNEILIRFASYGFRPTALAVKPLKSRWGSCTSRGKITINSELIKLDPVYTGYVIVHELCHLKHHNHGAEFYRLLGEMIPDYKILRKELRSFLTV